MALETTTTYKLTVIGMVTGVTVDIEIAHTYFRNGSGVCRMTSNTSSNLLCNNNARTLA